jgi:hypothetical protein
MPITVANLLAGAADLNLGPFGATEPTDATTALDAAFRNAGGTNDGVNITVAQKFEQVSSDQTADIIASLPTDRSIQLETSLMELTMVNIQDSLNGGTIVTGAQVDTFEPVTDIIANPPGYRCVILSGKSAINGKASRLIVRRCMVTDDVKTSYKKGGVNMLGVSWTGHYVSATVAPWKFIQTH